MGIHAFSQNGDVPDTPNKDEILASQYYQNKEFDKAAVLYEKLFYQKLTYAFYQPYINCLFELKNFEMAEKVIKKQIKLHPKDLYYLTDLGYTYKLKGDTKKSEKQYNAAIDQISISPQQAIDLANSFLARQETKLALKTYNKGRKIFSGIYSFYFEQAELYAKLGDMNAMYDEYLSAIDETYENIERVENALQQYFEKDPDNQKSDAFKTHLLKRLQQDPDKMMYSELLIWLAMEQKDFEAAFVQAKAIDKRNREDGKRVYDLAKIAYTSQNYDVAIKAYQYVIGKGSNNYYYVNSRMELVAVMKEKITGTQNYTVEDIKELENLYITTINELGKSSTTLVLLKDYAHLLAFYLHRSDEAMALLNENLKLANVSPRSIAECKLELADVTLFTGDVWEATLLYSQVEKAFKSDPLGHEAKFRNAHLSYYIGDFKWAQAQLNVLKAATSKLIANDALELSMLISDNIDADSTYDGLLIFSRSDLLIYQNKFTEAILTLDTLTKLYPSHTLADEVLFKKYIIFSRQGKFKESSSFLQEIVTNFPNDILADDALFRLAEMNEKIFKDTEKAKELYQDVIIKYPGSLYVVEARKHFRILRGDQLN